MFQTADADRVTNKEISDQTIDIQNVDVQEAEFANIVDEETKPDFILSKEHMSQEELSSSNQKEQHADISSSSSSSTNSEPEASEESAQLFAAKPLVPSFVPLAPTFAPSVPSIPITMPISPSTSDNSFLAAKRVRWLKKKDQSVKISEAIVAPTGKKIVFNMILMIRSSIFLSVLERKMQLLLLMPPPDSLLT